MTIALIAIALVPLLVTFVCVPQMPDMVPTRFGAGGEVLRYSNRMETFFLPAIGVFLAAASYLTARRQADAQAADGSEAAAELTYARLVRNGIVTGVIIGVASIYFTVAALLGTGLPF